jgi:acyl carrier protein
MNMTREDIIRITNEVFADEFEIQTDRLKPEARIFDEFGLDSLDVVDLIVAIQKRFGVQIREDERVRSIRTLGDVYSFIELIKTETETPPPPT